MSDRQCPALFIAAPEPNQGKTTLTAALARFHRNRGREVRVFKTGPDFLDPMVLELASGNPVYQLDLWMSDENHCRGLLYEAAETADLILIEGVMGLFDGDQSSADLATLFGIPVLVIIDGSAMAQTFGSIAYGLANYRDNLPFAGVFANFVTTDRHYEKLAGSLPGGIKSYGWFKRDKNLALPERHLFHAADIADLDERIEALATALNAVDQSLPAAVDFSASLKVAPEPVLKGMHIGIAHDAAFSLIYRANLDLLRELGAELTYFSPLEDEMLPPVDALYLPGGYPELHLKALSSNTEMHDEIAEFYREGRPIVAESGGMLYLLDSLANVDGKRENMVCLLAGNATMQQRLSNLGMQKLDLPEGDLRGHTNHFSKVHSPLSPLTISVGARAGRTGEPVYRQRRLTASCLHIYFPSNPETAAQLFVPSV